jgi:hypothetical protein
MRQQRRYCSAEEKAKSSLEAIRCQQRATLEKRNAREGATKVGMLWVDRVVPIVQGRCGMLWRG